MTNVEELYATRRKLQVEAVVSATDISSLDEYLHRPRNRDILRIISETIPKPPCEILDLGCGRAFAGEYFARQGYSVTCADLPEVLGVLQREIPVKYLSSPDLETEFPGGTYDVILCMQVIEHLVNDIRLLFAIRNHLVDGGIVCVSSVALLAIGDYLVGHVRSYPAYALANLMLVSGFEVLRDLDLTQTYSNSDPDTAVLCIGRKNGG